MNCKDCIHYDVCEQLEKIGVSKVSAFDCGCFKDKSRIVELPCKFQQKVYVIPTIENGLNNLIEMKCIGFSLTCDSYVANLINDKNKLYQPCFGSFGKTVFLTKEETEKALKECKD